MLLNAAAALYVSGNGWTMARGGGAGARGAGEAVRRGHWRSCGGGAGDRDAAGAQWQRMSLSDGASRALSTSG